MNIYEVGIAKGEELGRLKTLIENIEAAMKNFNISLQQSCEGLGSTVEEYENAKKEIAAWGKR